MIKIILLVFLKKKEISSLIKLNFKFLNRSIALLGVFKHKIDVEFFEASIGTRSRKMNK